MDNDKVPQIKHLPLSDINKIKDPLIDFLHFFPRSLVVMIFPSKLLLREASSGLSK